MPKTIWILNQTAGTPTSGWGERHYFFAKHWVEKGYEVKIISGSYNHLFTKQPKIEGKFTYQEIEKGITFCWVKVPKYKNSGFAKFWSNFIFTWRTRFLSEKKLGKPDVILLSSMPIFPIVTANYLKRKFGANKLITEVRDLWPLTPIHLKGYSKNHPLVKIVGWFERYAYKKSDAIVSLLPNAKKYITSISKVEEKFNYIPNGIDIGNQENQNISIEIRNKIPQDKFIIGYAGTIGFANSMEFFVKAIKQIKNKEVHFVLVGDGLLKKQFQTDLLGYKNVTFVDKIPKQQVQSILSLFDVCYVGRYKSPLYKHGVSYNKYFDYMLASKPILESSEYIKSQTELANCGLIVEPECPEAIVKGIKKLMSLSKLELETLGENGYDYVEKYHNFQYLSDKYIKLF